MYSFTEILVKLANTYVHPKSTCQLTDIFSKTIPITDTVPKHVSNQKKKHLLKCVLFHCVPFINFLIHIFPVKKTII